MSLAENDTDNKTEDDAGYPTAARVSERLKAARTIVPSHIQSAGRHVHAGAIADHI
jgi:hypothetical protein